MGKPNKRRAKKQKRREQRLRKNRVAMTSRRKLEAMDDLIRHNAPIPEFKINCKDASADIKALVTGGIERFGETYTRAMDFDTIVIMGEHTKHGWGSLVDSVTLESEDMCRGDTDRALRQMFDREIGNGILWGAQDNLIRRALPMSCFTLDPGEKHWNVQCRSLVFRKTKHGSLYFSPHQPVVEFNGKPWKVMFTRHCLEQLGDRIIPKWNKFYIGQAYVFGFLYECVYFEPLYLSSGQPAFAVFNSCLRAGSEIRKFMRGIVGVETDKELSGYYYRVGYCPLILDSGMAVAKTFLTPGYWQTPERKTLSKGGKKYHRTKLEIEQASDEGINTMSVSECRRTRAAVRWFHDHGVPQVKKLDHEVFRDMVGPYSLESSQSEPPSFR